MKKIFFVVFRVLFVKFLDDCGGSEGAVDFGGLIREFLRFVIRELFIFLGVFIGGDRLKVIIFNSEGNYCFKFGR